MYADSILKMLKDIRKAVRTSIKLQSDSSVFAQFLEEVRFGTHEIVFTEDPLEISPRGDRYDLHEGKRQV